MTTNRRPFQLMHGMHLLISTEYILLRRRSKIEIDYRPMHVLIARLADLEQMENFRIDAQETIGNGQ